VVRQRGAPPQPRVASTRWAGLVGRASGVGSGGEVKAREDCRGGRAVHGGVGVEVRGEAVVHSHYRAWRDSEVHTETLVLTAARQVLFCSPAYRSIQEDHE
jgi:hypothetical protein